MTPIDPCACGHVRRIHGRAWLDDDNCRACDCPEFEPADKET